MSGNPEAHDYGGWNDELHGLTLQTQGRSPADLATLPCVQKVLQLLGNYESLSVAFDEAARNYPADGLDSIFADQTIYEKDSDLTVYLKTLRQAMVHAGEYTGA